MAARVPPILDTPAEIFEKIVLAIDGHEGLIALGTSCKGASEALAAERTSLWRQRFDATFDFKKTGRDSEIKGLYLSRQEIRKSSFKDFLGSSVRNKYAGLALIRDLINESYAVRGPPGNDASISKNLKVIDEDAARSGLLINMLTMPRGPANMLYFPIFVALFAMTSITSPAHRRRQLTASRPQAVPFQGVVTSQWIVYMDSDQNDARLFRCSDNAVLVNMEWLANLANFFKYHLSGHLVNSVSSAFGALSANERPQLWRGKIRSFMLKIPNISGWTFAPGEPIGRFWKGTYAHLLPTDLIRYRRDATSTAVDIWPDDDNDGTGIDDFEITMIPRRFRCKGSGDEWTDYKTAVVSCMHRIPGYERVTHLGFYDIYRLPIQYQSFIRSMIQEDRSQMIWPDWFNELLGERQTRLGYPDQNPEALYFKVHGDRSFHRSNQPPTAALNGTSIPDFSAAGFINPLPDQVGIAGWQRLEMFSFERERNGDLRADNVFSYEAVITPGNQVVMGRWRDPNSGQGVQENSGPFILWNTDTAHSQALVSMDSGAQAGPGATQ